MDGSGDEGSGETAEKGVWISKEEMVRLGLDRWSEGDEVFLEEVVRKYFGRDVEVEGGKIGWCC